MEKFDKRLFIQIVTFACHKEQPEAKNKSEGACATYSMKCDVIEYNAWPIEKTHGDSKEFLSELLTMVPAKVQPLYLSCWRR